MLTDTKLKNLKPGPKPYKVTDGKVEGLYAHVQPGGTIAFRLDYRLNGRRETFTVGRYGPDGMGLADAREAAIEARKWVADGMSPAQDFHRASGSKG